MAAGGLSFRHVFCVRARCVPCRAFSTAPRSASQGSGARRRVVARVAATACIGASAALAWLALRDPAEPREEDARYAAAIARLPDLERAQATRVVLVKRFLSDADLAELDARLAALLREPLGTFSRDANGVPQLCGAPWETTYLHTNGAFARACPDLRHRLLALAGRVDAAEGWGLLGGDSVGSAEKLAPRAGACGGAQLRTVELHRVLPGGALADRRHFDGGSLVTVDVLLSRPAGADFAGGEFCTPELDGTMAVHAGFERGDALVFVSHKRHCVAPVRAGVRRVLVAELWDGPERTCAHRCMDPRRECAYTVAAAQAERFVRADLPET